MSDVCYTKSGDECIGRVVLFNLSDLTDKRSLHSELTVSGGLGRGAEVVEVIRLRGDGDVPSEVRAIVAFDCEANAAAAVEELQRRKLPCQLRNGGAGLEYNSRPYEDRGWEREWVIKPATLTRERSLQAPSC